MRLLAGWRRHWDPYLVLVAGLVVTAASGLYAERAHRVQEQLRFDSTADEVRHAIEGRLDAYIALLRGTAGLFAASDDVSAAEFHSYVERLALADRYQGVQGIGYSRLITAQERESVARALRAEKLPFRYWPDVDAPVIHAIVYLEPRDTRNLHALGFNMWSEPVRRQAMERARDQAVPAATARVRLVQEDVDPEREQAGFLIYVPVYDGGVVPPTLAGRRAALRGFVYSPFRADDLLRSVTDTYLPRSEEIEVYDGEPADGRLLHRSGPSGSGRMGTRRAIDVAGRQWSIVIRGGFRGSDPIFHGVLLLAVGGGIVLSALLFTVTRTEIRAREAAERVADELRRSEEALRAASTAKDEFLAVVSHELRTPLNAIIGWASMLRGGMLPPDRLEYALGVIERNATAQARLVEDLLELSRAVGGRLRLAVGPVDLNATLLAALDTVRPAAEARGIRLSSSGIGGLDTMTADGARLLQVFWNLLSNAIKFTPPGGAVTLSAARARSGVEIAVRDTGRGIDPEFLPHVFERFRQADTSTTRSHGGIGLGLAIARAIVELHGGTISVQSDGENAGAVFTVYLPVSDLHPHG